MNNEIIERIWYEVKNMDGFDLEWDWMTEGGSESEYLSRDDVLKLVENHLTSHSTRQKRAG